MASSNKVIKDINILSEENWMGGASEKENKELLAALKEAKSIEKADPSYNQSETDEAVKNLAKIAQEFQKIPKISPLNSPEKQKVNPNVQSGNNDQGKIPTGSSVQNKNQPGAKSVTQRPRYQICATKRVKMISEKLKAFEGGKDGVVTIKLRASQFVLIKQILESSCEIFGQATASNLQVLDPFNPAIAHLLANKEQIKRDNLKEDKILPVSPTVHQGSQTGSIPENPGSMQQPALQSKEMEKPPFLPPIPAVPAPSVPVFNNSQSGLDHSQEASSPAQEPVFPPPHHHTWSSGPRGRGSRGQRHNPYEHHDRNSLIQHQVWVRQKLRETDPTRRGNRGGWRGRGSNQSNWY